MPNNTQKNCRKDKPFIKIAVQWLAQNKIRWKESTYSKYYHIVNNVIADSIGGLPISAISAKTVQAQVNQMLIGGLSVVSAKDYVIIVNCVLGYARAENYLCPEKVTVCYPQKQENEINILSEREQLILVDTLRRSLDLTKLGVIFALYTGVRCGELCALQWKDIDLEKSTVYVSKTLQRIQNRDKNAKSKTKIVIMPPKTRKSVRRIPLPRFLVEMLCDFQCSDGEAYLLTGNNCFIEPRNMQNKFKRYLADCSIKTTNFHALRHTFATRCVEVGFDMKTLSEILGHSSVNITMNLYVHSSFELKIINMEKLNAIAI